MKMVQSLCVVVFMSMAATGAAGAEWTAFRGTGDGRATSTSLPTTWSSDSNIAWAVRLPSTGQSSPVVWNGRAFLTATSGETKDVLHALCYQLSDGRQLWQRDLKSSRPFKRGARTSVAAPTAAVDADGVYFLFDSGDLFAFDHEGKSLWHADVNQLAGPFQSDYDFASSVRPSSTGLVVHYTHTGPSAVVSIARDSGRLQWKHELTPDGEGSWNTPIVTTVKGDEAVLISRAGGAVALRARTGERLWGYETKWTRATALPSMVTSGTLVIVPSAEPTGTVAVPVENGGEPVWRASGPSNGITSPLVVGEYLFLVSSPGVVFCLRVATGEELWRHRLPASGWASPIAVGDHAYFFTAQGGTTILAAEPSLRIVGVNTLDLPEPLYSVVPIRDGFLFRTPTRLIKVANVPSSQSVHLDAKVP